MHGPEVIESLAKEWSHADESDDSYANRIPGGTSYDSFLKEFLTDFNLAVKNGTDIPMRMYVSNTHNSNGKGSHWITIAVSVRWSV